MQRLPDDVRDPASAPAATAERPADSSPPRPSRLKRYGDAILLGLVAAALIRICSTLLASWLPAAEELAQPGYTLLRVLATLIVLPLSLSIPSCSPCKRTDESHSSCYSYYPVPKLPAVVSGLFFAEFLSGYRGTSFLLLGKMLIPLPRLTTFGISIDPSILLLILIHSAGILTVAALGYLIHSKSKLTNPDNESPPVA